MIRNIFLARGGREMSPTCQAMCRPNYPIPWDDLQKTRRSHRYEWWCTQSLIKCVVCGGVVLTDGSGVIAASFLFLNEFNEVIGLVQSEHQNTFGITRFV